MKNIRLFMTFVFIITSVNLIYSQDKVYKIGDKGPAGGFIFYDKGNYSNEWRYLEAAPSDQSPGMQWYNDEYIEIEASGTAIGTGKMNTVKILAAQKNGKYAAKLCATLKMGGKNDWFLPSRDELNLMYENLCKNNIGGFKTVGYPYWSSSENGVRSAYFQYFEDGLQDRNAPKHLPARVRAVRAF